MGSIRNPTQNKGDGVKINKLMFKAYESVRRSGITNMFDVKTVGQLSGLEKEEIMTIMKSYGELKEKYDE